MIHRDKQTWEKCKVKVITMVGNRVRINHFHSEKDAIKHGYNLTADFTKDERDRQLVIFESKKAHSYLEHHRSERE